MKVIISYLEQPRRLPRSVLMRDWRAIPTALSPTETAALQRFCRDRRIVEFGALLGYSTRAIAEVGWVVSVDRHHGYGPPTYRRYMSNIQDHLDRIQPIVADALDRPTPVGDRYFVDLDGTYATTRAMLARLAEQHGLVAVHDFRRLNCGGVERAIRDAGYRVLETVDTLAICERRAE